jgi:hypothetical protein
MMVRKPKVSAGASAWVIRRSVTLFQRSCCFLRRSVAAHLLPDGPRRREFENGQLVERPDESGGDQQAA